MVDTRPPSWSLVRPRESHSVVTVGKHISQRSAKLSPKLRLGSRFSANWAVVLCVSAQVTLVGSVAQG